MMRIINKIYIWFKKVILNILGVIRDMINKDNEYEVKIMESKCEIVKFIIEKSADGVKYIVEKSADGVKYIVEKSADGVKYIFGSRKIRLSLGVALLISCINIPDDKKVDDRKELGKGEC